MLIIDGVDGLLSRAGQELGVSPWRRVCQDDINAFADVTNDRQWIHVDPESAQRSRFGGTIAHGFFTLSLLTELQRSAFQIENISHGLNYGLDRVRFPAPTPVGSAIRAVVTLLQVDVTPGGAQAKYRFVIECDATEKPVCVADFLVRYFRPSI